MSTRRGRLSTLIAVGPALAVLILATPTFAQDGGEKEGKKEPEKTEEKSQPSIKIEVKGQLYSETTDFGAGQDRQGSRTDIHFQRLRLTLTGMLTEKIGFKFQTCGNCGTTKQGALGYAVTAQDVDWNDRDIRIIDGYAIFNLNSAANLKIGLTKIPLTRANLDDCFAPLSLDRSMFVYTPYGSSPAKFSRDLGAVVWGGFNDDKLRYFGALMQGREGLTKTNHPFSGAVVTSSIEPRSAFEWVGRVHYAFLDPEAGSGYMGSYLGELKVFTVGGGLAYEPDAVYKNVTAAGVVQNTDTVNYSAYAADFMFEYPTKAGTPTITGQYLKTDFEDAYKTNFNPGDRLANIAGLNGQKKGGYVKGAYILPVKLHGEGLLQPYFVSESWQFAHLLGIDGQKVTQYGGGLNYYIKGQNVRVTGEFLKTSFDKTDRSHRWPRGPGDRCANRQVEGIQHVSADAPDRDLTINGRVQTDEQIIPQKRRRVAVIKRLSLALVMLVFVAVAAFAAPATGKVAAINGKNVQITLSGEKEDWVKKNAPVKIKGGTGKITEVAGDKVTINTSKASELKVGDEVTFDKARVGGGC